MAKFRKNSGAALFLNCLMCGKGAANLVNSAARVQRIFAKRAANVRRMFFNYVVFFVVLESCTNINP